MYDRYGSATNRLSRCLSIIKKRLLFRTIRLQLTQVITSLLFLINKEIEEEPHHQKVGTKISFLSFRS